MATGGLTGYTPSVKPATTTPTTTTAAPSPTFLNATGTVGGGKVLAQGPPSTQANFVGGGGGGGVSVSSIKPETVTTAQLGIVSGGSTSASSSTPINLKPPIASAGFSVAAAEAAGYQVYGAGTLTGPILVAGGNVYNEYGKFLYSTNPSATTITAPIGGTNISGQTTAPTSTITLALNPGFGQSVSKSLPSYRAPPTAIAAPTGQPLVSGIDFATFGKSAILSSAPAQIGPNVNAQVYNVNVGGVNYLTDVGYVGVGVGSNINPQNAAIEQAYQTYETSLNYGKIVGTANAGTGAFSYLSPAQQEINAALQAQYASQNPYTNLKLGATVIKPQVVDVGYATNANTITGQAITLPEAYQVGAGGILAFAGFGNTAAKTYTTSVLGSPFTFSYSGSTITGTTSTPSTIPTSASFAPLSPNQKSPSSSTEQTSVSSHISEINKIGKEFQPLYNQEKLGQANLSSRSLTVNNIGTDIYNVLSREATGTITWFGIFGTYGAAPSATSTSNINSYYSTLPNGKLQLYRASQPYDVTQTTLSRQISGLPSALGPQALNFATLRGEEITGLLVAGVEAPEVATALGVTSTAIATQIAIQIPLQIGLNIGYSAITSPITGQISLPPLSNLAANLNPQKVALSTVGGAEGGIAAGTILPFAYGAAGIISAPFSSTESIQFIGEPSATTYIPSTTEAPSILSQAGDLVYQAVPKAISTGTTLGTILSTNYAGGEAAAGQPINPLIAGQEAALGYLVGFTTVEAAAPLGYTSTLTNNLFGRTLGTVAQGTLGAGTGVALSYGSSAITGTPFTPGEGAIAAVTGAVAFGYGPQIISGVSDTFKTLASTLYTGTELPGGEAAAGTKIATNIGQTYTLTPSGTGEVTAINTPTGYSVLQGAGSQVILPSDFQPTVSYGGYPIEPTDTGPSYTITPRYAGGSTLTGANPTTGFQVLLNREIPLGTQEAALQAAASEVVPSPFQYQTEGQYPGTFSTGGFSTNLYEPESIRLKTTTATINSQAITTYEPPLEGMVKASVP